MSGELIAILILSALVVWLLIRNANNYRYSSYPFVVRQMELHPGLVIYTRIEDNGTHVLILGLEGWDEEQSYQCGWVYTFPSYESFDREFEADFINDYLNHIHDDLKKAEDEANGKISTGK